MATTTAPKKKALKMGASGPVYGSGILGGSAISDGGYGTPATGPYTFGSPPPMPVQGVPWSTMEGASNTMWSLAGGIEDEERRRYEGGLGTLTDAYNESRSVLNKDIDTGLLFSKASDAVGARGKQSINNLRRSLGARGLNPNSGAANAALSRLMGEQENALIGAERDIALENQRRREVNAAVSFANAFQLANYRNAPVGGARLETTQNLIEQSLAREALANQRDSNKKANRTNILGSLIGGGASILGGLLA